MPLATIASVLLLFASPNVGGIPAVHLEAWQAIEPEKAPETAPEAAQPIQAPKEEVKPEQAPPAEATPQPAPAESQPRTADKPKSVRKKKKRGSAKKIEASAGTEGPTKTVVRNGSTTQPDMKFTSGLSHEQQNSHLQNTNRLLASAEANLKKMAMRQANSSQMETMKQVRKYMDQAKAALGTGDLDRGHTLAYKAQLLSDELVRH